MYWMRQKNGKEQFVFSKALSSNPSVWWAHSPEGVTWTSQEGEPLEIHLAPCVPNPPAPEHLSNLIKNTNQHLNVCSLGGLPIAAASVCCWAALAAQWPTWWPQPGRNKTKKYANVAGALRQPLSNNQASQQGAVEQHDAEHLSNLIENTNRHLNFCGLGSLPIAAAGVCCWAALLAQWTTRRTGTKQNENVRTHVGNAEACFDQLALQ